MDLRWFFRGHTLPDLRHQLSMLLAPWGSIDANFGFGMRLTRRHIGRGVNGKNSLPFHGPTCSTWWACLLSVHWSHTWFSWSMAKGFTCVTRWGIKSPTSIGHWVLHGVKRAVLGFKWCRITNLSLGLTSQKSFILPLWRLTLTEWQDSSDTDSGSAIPWLPDSTWADASEDTTGTSELGLMVGNLDTFTVYCPVPNKVSSSRSKSMWACKVFSAARDSKRGADPFTTAALTTPCLPAMYTGMSTIRWNTSRLHAHRFRTWTCSLPIAQWGMWCHVLSRCRENRPTSPHQWLFC